MAKGNITVSVSDKELNRAVKKITRVSNAASEEFGRAVNKTTTNLHSKAVLAAPADRGRLRQSIHMRVRRSKVLGYTLTGEVYSDAFYAPYVEFGTKSHFRVTQGVPNLEQYAAQFKGSAGRSSGRSIFDNIKAWLRRTGHLPVEAAYFVTMKILEQGTKAQPFLFPAYPYEKRKYYAAVRKIITKYSAK